MSDTASGSLKMNLDEWLRFKRWLLARAGETKEQKDRRQARNRRRRRRRADVGRRARMFKPSRICFRPKRRRAS